MTDHQPFSAPPRSSGIKKCPTCQGTMQQLYDGRKGRKIWKCVTGCGIEEEIEQPEPVAAEPKRPTSISEMYRALADTDTDQPEDRDIPSDIRDIPVQEEPPVQPAPTQLTTRPSSDLTDWQGAALSKLKALIAQVQNVEQMKTEAEKIHAALTILEMRNLPALPWIKQKVPRATRAKSAQVDEPTAEVLDDMVCARCGRPFENRMQYKLGPGGTHICKGHCAPSRHALIPSNLVTAD